MPQSLLERLQIGEWDRMIDVNVKDVRYGIAAALPICGRRRAATSGVRTEPAGRRGPERGFVPARQPGILKGL